MILLVTVVGTPERRQGKGDFHDDFMHIQEGCETFGVEAWRVITASPNFWRGPGLHAPRKLSFFEVR